MSRRRVIELEEQVDPSTDISSLIDVSFLLLIYFIATSSMTPPEGDLGLNLPASESTSQAVKLEPLVLKIDAEGIISKGKGEAIESDPTARRLPNLVEELLRYKEAAKLTSSEPVVIVNADDGVASQRFVDVVNALSKVEIKNITLTGFRETR
jgi:biopolymer transport protein ExbD